MSFTPQTNGDLYAGEIMFGHYQVMESNIPTGTYYVIDHHLSDFLVRENGKGSAVRRYPNIEAAIKSFTPVTSEIKSVDPAASPVISNEGVIMAKAKAAAEPVAVVEEKRRGRKLAAGGVSGRARELIALNDAKKVKDRQTDAELLAQLRQDLPDSNVPANAIAHHRKRMEERIAA